MTFPNPQICFESFYDIIIILLYLLGVPFWCRTGKSLKGQRGHSTMLA